MKLELIRASAIDKLEKMLPLDEWVKQQAPSSLQQELYFKLHAHLTAVAEDPTLGITQVVNQRRNIGRAK